MPTREDETVTTKPTRIGWVVAQVARPDGVGHGCGAHRQPGVTGVSLLDGIGGEETEGVDGAGLEVVGHVDYPWIFYHEGTPANIAGAGKDTETQVFHVTVPSGEWIIGSLFSEFYHWGKGTVGSW